MIMSLSYKTDVTSASEGHRFVELYSSRKETSNISYC